MGKEKRKLPLAQSGLEEKIGYTFNKKSLLTTALTHSSYSNELKSKGVREECNERLEFLGDSVLSIYVSKYLYLTFSARQEGDLTKIRAAVVCEKALHKYASKLELGQFLRLGHGEEMGGGRERPSIVADAFEALLGAIYLDSANNHAVINNFLMPYVTEEIENISHYSSFIDYKTALQQLVQQAEGELLEYVLTGESGPDHDKTFEVEAKLNSNVIGRGQAHSKREAEQMAAHQALSLFGRAGGEK